MYIYKNIKPIVASFIFLPLAFICDIKNWIFSRLKLSLFHQRSRVIEILAEPNIVYSKKRRILIVITHVVSSEQAQNPEDSTSKIERLTKTIDGILSSFSHCNFQIILNTVPKQHLIAYLPEYQKRSIQVKEQSVHDPMFVEFKAQDEFISRINDFDWFLFLEDDIVIYDSYLLEKIEMFNRNSGNNRSLLIPNRYEMWDGVKTYIDLIGFKWHRASSIKIGDMKFAECQNPHGAFYVLSRSQLEIWSKSGRFWNNKVTMVGSLESAATGCLFECFSLYKPHPDNLNFFEVQHWDTKYSQKALN